MSEEFFSRQADLIPTLRLQVVVVGVGGIGSNLAHALCSMGVATQLTLVDFDEVGYENVAPGFFRMDDIGILKTTAIKYDLERRFGAMAPDIEECLNVDMMRGNADVVIACTDNIESRIQAWEMYKGSDALFIDARMGGTQCDVYCLQADDEQRTLWYEQTHVGPFDQLPCGESSTAPITKGAVPAIVGRIFYLLANEQEIPFHAVYDMLDGRTVYPRRL